MSQEEQGFSDTGSGSPFNFVECIESWTFMFMPKIIGKSGKSHEFDYGFYAGGEDNFLVLGKKYTSEIRNGLAALTYFNAQSDDVGANRKVIFSEKELPQEVKLLANALKIDVLYEMGGINSFLSASLKEKSASSDLRMDISSMLSLDKEEKIEKSKKKYRDRTRLIQEVLRSASAEEGATLNNIVFKCNLNYNSARKIVEELIRKELIGIAKDENEKTVYRITGGGSTMIEKLRYLEGMGSNG